MKKCPECGNPSYDGAPVCGNCGYVFPKQKPVVQKKKSIFEDNPEQVTREKPKANKPSNEPSVIDIIKEKKLIIGIILLITLIVICGIFITGSNNNNSSSQTIQTGDLAEYAAGDFSFKYPSSWEQVNLTDEDRENAIFFETDDNVTVEHYNVTSEAVTLDEVNEERLNYALYNGYSVKLLDTITVADRNASNIILTNGDEGYSRYVSLFGDEGLYVFKVSGDSIDSITSDSINSMLNSVTIN